jgi:hypothetical protein
LVQRAARRGDLDGRPREPSPPSSRTPSVCTSRRLRTYACRRAFSAEPTPAQRGSFHSIVDLHAEIRRYIDEHNHQPKPFSWAKTPRQILAALR